MYNFTSNCDRVSLLCAWWWLHINQKGWLLIHSKWSISVWGCYMCLYNCRHTNNDSYVLVDYWRSVLWKTPMAQIRHEGLVNRDIGYIWDSSSNGTFNFVYLILLIWKLLWTGGWLFKGACWMVAVKLGANSGFEMGRAFKIGCSKLCFLVFRHSGVLGYKGTFFAGAVLIVVGKEGRVAFGDRGTKLICCRGHIRRAKLFSGSLDDSGALDFEIWSFACGENIYYFIQKKTFKNIYYLLDYSKKIFWFTCSAKRCCKTGCWMGGEEETPGACTEGG